MKKEFKIADINLAPEGNRRIDWAWEYMPVLKLIADKEMAKKPRKKRLHSSVSLILLSTTFITQE